MLESSRHMPSTAIRQRAEQKFIPVLLDAIRVDSILSFDLYINANGNLVLYRSADLPFTDRTRQKLLENRVDRLYITSEAKAQYQRYIEANLPQILKDEAVSEEKKAQILYETSSNLVQEVWNNPTYGENIQRAKDLVTNNMEYLLKGRDSFLNLMTLSSFDYHTYTHSVNVCTFSLALAQQMGFRDEQFLHELGVGSLMHDIGKSRISTRIINKRAALSPIEFEIMKKHPKWGVEILSETDQIASASYYPVLQHHERGDRSGYPNGLSLDEMHIYSKIVAIADSFDAMTTERVYQHAMDSFPALKAMFINPTLFDNELLKAFAELMGPTGLADR
ncbi:MAG: HD domain-containing phosphohydrolase [Candidatus Zixiibacteriota bacterium]|mgnify:FL=1